MYTVKRKTVFTKPIKDGAIQTCYLMHIIVDTVADIPDAKENWLAGSRCDVLEDGGHVYMLSNGREWIEVNFFGRVSEGNGTDLTEKLLNLINKKSKINVIQLDDNQNETNIIQYFDTISETSTFLNSHKTNPYRVVIFEENGITKIDPWAFYCCTNLNSITIPYGVTSIGNTAFWGCTNLNSVTIPCSVTSIKGGTFADCANLNSITIPCGVTSIENNTFSGCTNLNSIIIPCSVTSIKFNAFSRCTNLNSITIPCSVTNIENNTFSGCTNITEIKVNKPQDSIPGAPWGATNAQVIWTG